MYFVALYIYIYIYIYAYTELKRRISMDPACYYQYYYLFQLYQDIWFFFPSVTTVYGFKIIYCLICAQVCNSYATNWLLSELCRCLHQCITYIRGQKGKRRKVTSCGNLLVSKISHLVWNELNRCAIQENISWSFVRDLISLFEQTLSEFLRLNIFITPTAKQAHS